MFDFLRFLDAFDPDDDIGKSMPEASDKVRTFNEDLTFTKAGIFRPQDLNVSERPVVDLPIAFQDVTIKRYRGVDEVTGLPKLVGEVIDRRLIRQSEVGQAIALPDASYFSSLQPFYRKGAAFTETLEDGTKETYHKMDQVATPAKPNAVQRALARTITEALKTYTPEPCPWQGSLIGLWHAAQRLLNYNVKDAAIKAANNQLIIETGEALRGLSRSVGDSSNGIVRRAIAAISNAADPRAALLAQKEEAEMWAKAAGNDKELAAREAQSCEEEFLKGAGITREELEHHGALRLHDGTLIHVNKVVHERMVHGEDGELIRLGYAEDGEMGLIMSADEIHDAEVEKAEEHLDERVAENLAFNAGRGMPPIPVLLNADIHRPEKAVENEEIVRIFSFGVVERATGNKQRFTVEGEAQAMTAKEGWDKQFPAFMATGLVEVGSYRRTFNGYWATRPDGSEVRAFGDAPETRPFDMDAVDWLGIVRDPFPGSGFSDNHIGCYAEQAGDVTVILQPDWYTLNVEYNPDMREKITRLKALKAEDVKAYAQRQEIHRHITAAFPDRSDCQRFLRGVLRQHIADLRTQAGWTIRMMKVLTPMFGVDLNAFFKMRGQVGADLAKLNYDERTIAWSFINNLRQELRADALVARVSNYHNARSVDYVNCHEFGDLMHKIEKADIDTLPVVRKVVESGILKMVDWQLYLLRDAMLSKREHLKKA